MDQTPIVSRVINVQKLPNSGQFQRVILTESEQIEIKKFYDLLDLKDFISELTVTPKKRGRVHITGNITANVQQACIITLEAVSDKITQDINLSFVPQDQFASYCEKVEEGVITLDLDQDLPDPYEGTTLDIGAIVLEQFALALNPYPKSNGAIFTDTEESTTEEVSPFAILKDLQTKTKS